MDLSVVQQHNDVATEVAQQFPQEHADFRSMNVHGVQMTVECEMAALRADRNAGDGRDPIMAQDMVVDRRLTAGAPGLTHRGNQQEAGFVDEHDMGCQPCGVFFTRGQTVRFHSAMSASLRSAARRSGFWWLHPN